MPSVLHVSGPAILRNGVMVEPMAQVSICEIQPCDGIAAFGFKTKSGYLTFCRHHLPDAGKKVSTQLPKSNETPSKE